MRKCAVCGMEKEIYHIWVSCACNHHVCQNCFLNRPEETERKMAELHNRKPRGV